MSASIRPPERGRRWPRVGQRWPALRAELWLPCGGERTGWRRPGVPRSRIGLPHLGDPDCAL